jgi:peptidoglycan/LPS O-acetylase OafA/YrhL
MVLDVRFDDGIAVTPKSSERAAGRTATGTGKDLTNLDVLRAAAVCCVLVSHILSALNRVTPGMGYGGFAVCLFFVHTALVLMWSLERRPNTLDFYIRRVARIYPLAIVAVLVAVLTHAPTGIFTEGDGFFHYMHPTLPQVMTHLLLVQNFFSGSFILYPMWSLPIEVQMYLLLPVLFFFLRKNMMLWPLLLMWGLAAATAHPAFGPQEVNLAVSIPYFLSGVIAYVGFSRRKAMLPGWSFVPALAAIVWLGGDADDWQRAWWPCLALGLVLPSFRQMGRNFFTKLCWQIARYSYGIYLTHPFSLVLAFYVCRGWPMSAQFAVLFSSLAVFSFASFHLIEAPFMRLGAKFAGRFAAAQAAKNHPSQAV